MCVSELKPLMVKAFAAVKGLVGNFCFASKTDSFPGRDISVTKWYREELVIRTGYSDTAREISPLPEVMVA